MFRNKRKTIGLFASDNFDAFQNEICKGIVDCAKEHDMNVAIFTLLASYSDEIFGPGELNILRLADINQLDGIIFAEEAGHYSSRELEVVKSICEKAPCPVVTLNDDLKFAPYVAIDNYHVLEELMEHFITVHKFTRIDYLSGTPEMEIAQERLRSYKDCMKRHGIYDERRIFHGDFWREKAAQSVEYFLNLEDELPEAIVCANDYSAMVVCHELGKRGILVPDDIAVSGCDDIEDAATYSPPLTTVQISGRSMGTIAFERLYSLMNKEEIPRVSYCEHKTIYRKSCSCNAHDLRDLTMKRQEILNQRTDKSVSNHRIMFLSIELQSAPSLDNLYQQIKDYLTWNQNYVNGFCICLSTDWKSRGKLESSFGFTDQVQLHLGIHNGKLLSPETFSRKQLLPAVMHEDRPLAYFFSSIHYRDHCYGYTAYNFEDTFANIESWQHFLISFTNALEAYRVRDELQQTVDELNTLYIHDSLTGLMNRRGFQIQSEAMYQQACKENLTLFSFSTDLDRLKYINDTYGHGQGDISLRRIGHALSAAAQNNEICARIGGDEFSVFALGYTKRDAENFATNFLGALERLNNSHKGNYPTEASWGYVLYSNPSSVTYEDIIRETDERMYQMKIDHRNK